MKRKRLLIAAGVFGAWWLVSLILPLSESYSDFGLGASGGVEVSCGPAIAPKEEVEFDEAFEQEGYDWDRSNGYSPAIFEGESAGDVCDGLHVTRRWWLVAIGSATVLCAALGLSAPTGESAVGYTYRRPGSGPRSGVPRAEAVRPRQPTRQGVANVDLTQHRRGGPPQQPLVTPTSSDHQLPEEPDVSVVDDRTVPKSLASASGGAQSSPAGPIVVLTTTAGDQREFAGELLVGRNPPSPGWSLPGADGAVHDQHARFLCAAGNVSIEAVGAAVSVIGPDGSTHVEPGGRLPLGSDAVVRVGRIRIAANLVGPSTQSG